jgi:four helix bundle protein
MGMNVGMYVVFLLMNLNQLINRKMNDLQKRLFTFNVRTMRFLRTLPKNYETKNISHQLTKSCSSIGANYEESQAASSRADFGKKIKISLREARESNYWLRLIAALEYDQVDPIEQEWLLNESTELKKILGSINNKVRQ